MGGIAWRTAKLATAERVLEEASVPSTLVQILEVRAAGQTFASSHSRALSLTSRRSPLERLRAMVTEADNQPDDGQRADLPIGTDVEQIRELVTASSALVATVRTLGEGAKKWSLQDIAASVTSLRTAATELETKAAEIGHWVTLLRQRATAREKQRRASLRPAAQALNKELREFSDGLRGIGATSFTEWVFSWPPLTCLCRPGSLFGHRATPRSFPSCTAPFLLCFLFLCLFLFSCSFLVPVCAHRSRGDRLAGIVTATSTDRIKSSMVKLDELAKSSKVGADTAMIRMPPRGSNDDLAWVPEPLVTARTMPENRSTFGSPWLLRTGRGAFRFGPASVPLLCWRLPRGRQERRGHDLGHRSDVGGGGHTGECLRDIGAHEGS